MTRISNRARNLAPKRELLSMYVSSMIDMLVVIFKNRLIIPNGHKAEEKSLLNKGEILVKSS
jgi:hypothetical protein